MKTPTARLLPTAAAVLALGFTSACGGESSDDGDKPEKSTQDKVSSAPTESPTPTEDTQAAPGKTLSKEELDKVALETADLKGHTVKTPTEEEVSGAGEEKAKSPECQPIAAVIGGAPEPAPANEVYRQMLNASGGEAGEGAILFETLAAYEQKNAEQLLTDLRKAVKGCSGGFTTTTGGDTSRYSSVQGLPAPTGADDALAYQVNGDFEGEKVPLVFNVVRSGSTVAIFYAMNLMDASKAEVPQSVVTAQINKLK